RTMREETKAMLNREFWQDKRGQEVHRDLVPHEEKLKTELVYDIVDRAVTGVTLMERFKAYVTGAIREYMEMMREKYSLDVAKGTKGNITLQSYDGLRKVQVAVQQHIDFDEKLSLAKEKIDAYLKEKTKDADPEIQTLIMNAFEVDKKGNVDAKKIFALKKYKISDPMWHEAMALIDEAVEIVGSKSYIRFYVRESVDEKWRNVSLDFAAIGG
ncbi:MAG: DUF3164 family protein, partial [Desulfobacula sp.]|nr:DUF3164 family protein [Desulfobacula sp.]